MEYYGKYLITFYFTIIHFISHDIHIILCIFLDDFTHHRMADAAFIPAPLH